jgi:hypothetical protein
MSAHVRLVRTIATHFAFDLRAWRKYERRGPGFSHGRWILSRSFLDSTLPTLTPSDRREIGAVIARNLKP